MSSEEVINAGVAAIIGEARAKAPAKPPMDLSKMDPLFKLLFESVATDFDVTVDEMLASGRGVKRVAKARMVVIWLLSRNYGFSLNEIASEIARDRTTIRHAAIDIDKMREDDDTVKVYLDQLCVDVEELRVETLGEEGDDLI